jgi:hypothetical protein
MMSLQYSALQGGETLLERSVIPNLLHKNKQILVDTAFSPVCYRPNSGVSDAPVVDGDGDGNDLFVLVTQWPLEVLTLSALP